MAPARPSEPGCRCPRDDPTSGWSARYPTSVTFRNIGKLQTPTKVKRSVGAWAASLPRDRCRVLVAVGHKRIAWQPGLRTCRTPVWDDVGGGGGGGGGGGNKCIKCACDRETPQIFVPFTDTQPVSTGGLHKGGSYPGDRGAPQARAERARAHSLPASGSTASPPRHDGEAWADDAGL